MSPVHQAGFAVIIDGRIVSSECPRSHTGPFPVILASIRSSVPVKQAESNMHYAWRA